jgi:hypothetical protein
VQLQKGHRQSLSADAGGIGVDEEWKLESRSFFFQSIAIAGPETMGYSINQKIFIKYSVQ